VALDAQGEYRAQLARLLIMLRQDGEAGAMLQAAEAAPPTDALSRDTMGCVYARLGDHAAALPHFIEAVRLEPRNSEYLYNQAVTLNFLGRVDEADTALETLISLEPGHARAQTCWPACANRVRRPTISTASHAPMPRRVTIAASCCLAMPSPRSWRMSAGRKRRSRNSAQ